MAGTHYAHVNESLQSYKVTSHRHTPEIAQGLIDLGLAGARVVFAPHLVPMTRGLLSTVYLDIGEGIDTQAAVRIYDERYQGEWAVTVHPPDVMPATGEVRGSNRAHIGVAVDQTAGVLIASCAIDNLVKGTAGQAEQCANIVLGLDESAGLAAPGPVV